MKQSLLISLIASLGLTNAIRINGHDIYFPYDEEKYVHQYRHAVALDKALKNATEDEKE